MKTANPAAYYCAIYPKLAEVARYHGYALAVHGSLATDMDLVAVPWEPTVSTPMVVVEDITTQFCLDLRNDPDYGNHKRLRVAISLSFESCFIDLSFFPAAEEAYVDRPLMPATTRWRNTSTQPVKETNWSPS